MPNQTVSYSNGVITLVKRNGSTQQMAFDGDSLDLAGGPLIGARCNFSQGLATDTPGVMNLISPAPFPNDPAQFDTSGFRDAAHPTRLRIPTDGVYLVGFAFIGLTVAIDFGSITIRSNGGAKSEALLVEMATEPTSDFLSLNSVPMSGSALMKYKAGDYIEIVFEYHGHDFGGGPSGPSDVSGSLWITKTED